MKSILMLFLLATLSNPVLAKSNANMSECLQMYRTYLKDYGASKFIPPKQMLAFISQCMPADYLNNSMSNDERQNQGVIHINGNSGNIFTIKT